MTTREDLEKWFEKGMYDNNTHLIVVCDTFSYEDYPVYVTKDQDVREVYNEYDGKNMQRVVWVYSYNKNLEDQLHGCRAYNFD